MVCELPRVFFVGTCTTDFSLFEELALPLVFTGVGNSALVLGCVHETEGLAVGGHCMSSPSTLALEPSCILAVLSSGVIALLAQARCLELKSRCACTGTFIESRTSIRFGGLPLPFACCSEGVGEVCFGLPVTHSLHLSGGFCVPPAAEVLRSKCAESSSLRTSLSRASEYEVRLGLPTLGDAQRPMWALSEQSL